MCKDARELIKDEWVRGVEQVGIRIQNKKRNCQDGIKELQGYKQHWIVQNPN